MSNGTKEKNGVMAIEWSGNRKLGARRMNATYVSLDSCMDGCPVEAVCYTGTGRTAIHTRRLNKQSEEQELDALQLAKNEAEKIDQLVDAPLPLRLHVSGDTSTIEGTRLLASASAKYSKRHNNAPVFSYTHSHLIGIKRSEFGSIKIRASIENLDQLPEVRRLGYEKAAVIVSKHPTDGRAWKHGRETIIPCPNQTRSDSRGKPITCADCRLCWTTDHTIAFALHGTNKGKIGDTLGSRAKPIA
jgi:hypothetical protein